VNFLYVENVGFSYYENVGFLKVELAHFQARTRITFSKVRAHQMLFSDAAIGRA
jgi:hypothetical protein